MPRILIVDDNLSLLRVSSIAVKKEGYEVEVAADAEAGLRLLAESGFDLVLVDQSMPGMKGIDFVHELHRRNTNGMVAFMTGLDNADIADSGFPYLLKPFNYSQLMRFVNSLLQKTA